MGQVQGMVELKDGEIAPDFELRRPEGGRVPLSHWRGKRVLLIFIQPRCAFSRAILPVLAGIAANPPPGQPATVIISFGREAENQHLAREYGIRCPLLLQEDIEVAARLGIAGTPSGYLLDECGRVIGSLQSGAAAILTRIGITPAHRSLQGEGGNRTTPYTGVNDRLRRLLDEQRMRDIARRMATADSRRGDAERPPAGPTPLVSVILTTRDRPGLLPIALKCYGQQTYAPRELVVIDDGTQFPADPGTIAAVGGRLVRVEEGMTLGAKLNRGASETQGGLCQKWDDDDWYAPRFLETLVSAHLRQDAGRHRSTVAYLTYPLLFDLARWRILDWNDDDPCGSTLLFEREAWERTPFQDVRHCDDFWFLIDQLEMGASTTPVEGGKLYAIVRHDTASGEWGHSWTHWGRQRMEEYLQGVALPSRDPAAVLPRWALSMYRSLSADSRVQPPGQPLPQFGTTPP